MYVEDHCTFLEPYIFPSFLSVHFLTSMDQHKEKNGATGKCILHTTITSHEEKMYNIIACKKFILSSLGTFITLY